MTRLPVSSLTYSAPTGTTESTLSGCARSFVSTFNPGTCRASQGNVVPHGVSMKDLSMRGTVDAWTACAKSSIKEKPPGPISGVVHLQFNDSGRFRGATCNGCPGALAACVASSTGKTVSLQFKSGDVTGEPSFDVGVTFTCD